MRPLNFTLKSVTVAFGILFAQAAFAGMPIGTETTCPIGGEKFEITVTATCSTMGRTMSMGPITSCDFVTRLPICPSNHLPLYKDFCDDELGILSQHVTTQKYQTNLSKPDWLRAYHLAELLVQTGEAHSMLQFAQSAPRINEYGASYVEAVRACLSDMTKENCQPHFPFKP